MSEISDLFGIPEHNKDDSILFLDTGFFIGGPSHRDIMDSKVEVTGYSIGGPLGKDIIRRKDFKRVGYLGGVGGNLVFDENSNPTNYRFTRTGRIRVIYVENNSQ